MAKKVIENPNANLPPLVVLESFLNEKKKEFVTNKLHEFGLVRKEVFDRKLGHQKKDFKLKKFLGKRYRFVSAPMTEAEIEQIFTLIQTLLSITPKATSNLSNGKSFVDDKKTNGEKENLPISLLGLLLILVGLAGLGGGGYAAYLVFTNGGALALELAAIIAASGVFFSLTLIVLARILQIVSSLR
jgi:uncharacterized protein YjgD (DUF1641 family)